MILLTGATGFVGKRVLKGLLAQKQQVVCIARNSAKIEAHDNLIVLKGDLENSDVLSKITEIEQLKDVDRILHMAALYDLSASSGACYMANVVATMNLLSLSKKLPKFKSFYHVSTVAIAGDYDGLVPKDEVDFGQSFSNHYAKTKAQAESLLKRGLDESKLCIFRPGIIVGDSIDGVFDKADGPYMAIEFFKRIASKVPAIKYLPYYPLPMDENSQLPLVPVDVVVEILVSEVIRGELRGTHHLVAPDAPSVGDFAALMFKKLGYSGSIKATAGAKLLSNTFKHLPKIESIPTPILDYMASKARYDVSDEVKRFAPLKSCQWTEFKEVFFRQAITKL